MRFLIDSENAGWGRVADANGKVRPVALCDDEIGAEEMLAAMKPRAKRIARGDDRLASE